MRNFYSNINKSKKILENHDVIAIPTETVYGLAANAYSDKAVKKIFKLKNRTYKNPLIVHYSNVKDLNKDCETSKIFNILYKKFCPGPLTFILNKKNNSKISKYVTANKRTVAIRFPKNILTQSLLSKINFPLAAPSANISTKVSSVKADHVRTDFGNKIKFILDGGKCKIGLESTILDLTGRIVVLRPGAITIDQLQRALKRKIIFDHKSKKIKSPGQLKLHYSPGIPVRMNAKYPKKNEAFIQLKSKIKNKINYFSLSKKGNMKEAAKNLFTMLRYIKNKGYRAIAVEKISRKGLGLAINDRLKKASNK